MRNLLLLFLGVCVFSMSLPPDLVGAQTPSSQPTTAPMDWRQKAIIANLRDQAHLTGLQIVYICNASASMADKMDSLKTELQKSVSGLIPIQSFDVIFVQDSVDSTSHYTKLSADMVRADDLSKKKLDDFLKDIACRGSCQVIPALTDAFHLKTKPDFIYLLTDGPFKEEGDPVVIEAINKLNADHDVKVDTILFLGKEIDPDALKEATDTLKKIANQNGGTFTKVNIEDLKEPEPASKPDKDDDAHK